MILFSLSGFSQSKIKPSQISNATKQSFKEVLDINKLETSLDSTNTVLSTKIDSSGISSSLDEFYNKTQSNTRFINEDGDTITGTILVPTPATGTNTTQVANTAFVNQNTGIIQFQDNIIKTVQGTTSETLVGTYTIKGGSIGANGSLDIFWNPHINAAGNSCTFRLYANGLLIATATLNTNNYAPLYTWIINTGATNSQKLGSSTTISGSQWNANTAGLTQLTIDTMQNITITATIQPSATTPNIGYIDRIRAITYYSK